jgi:uncharacterized protein with von Willebrand factor type A (vWA) domain
VPETLTARLVGFAGALRDHGVVAGTSEVADAGLVLTTLGLEDRERLREGLASALMRRSGQRPVFDDVFDVWFPAAVGERSDVVAPQRIPANDAERRAAAAGLRLELEAALASSDRAALDRLAARVVAELGRLANEATTGAYSAQQALDVLAPQTAIAGALARMQDAAVDLPGGSGDGSGGSGGAGVGAGGPPAGTAFADRFTRDELRSEVAALRRRVEVETRRRNAEARGRQRISRYAIRQPADQTPFLLSGRTDVEELRRTIAPLAKVLATRLAARQRRAARGGIDLRRTLRRSLSTGGVPIDPAYARRHVGRPDLVVLADLSSSVAGFSRFTILLLQALGAQFRRIRILGFVNVVDDLTRDVLDAAPGTDLTTVFDDTARLTRHHRNSDYGAVLQDVVAHHLDAIGHRTTVLILGDARSNGTDPRLADLREIVERAAHVIWLNPEPARSWGTGDSVAHRYAEIVDMHECRNVAQLRQFVTRALPV